MSVNITRTDTEFEEYKDLWQTCRDAIEGKKAIFEGGKRYLPKLDQMSPEEYQAYQMRAGWYGATAGTKSAFVGMIMRKDPQVTLPPSMEEFTEDATLSGTSLQDLGAKILDRLFTDGRCGILVDHEGQQTEEDRPITRAEAERSNMRPYVTLYEADQILPPKMGYVNNKYVLTQLRLEETKAVEGNSEFDTDYKNVVRVLDLNEGKYRVRVFEEVGEQDEKDNNNIEDASVYEQVSEVYPEMNGQNLDYIPFTFINAQDQSHEYSKPPLIDLAELNIDYYRTKADYKHGLHFTGLPTAVVTGVDDDDQVFRIGSSQAWQFRNEQADAKYLEFEGQGLSEIREELKNLKDNMASLGARMLATEKRQAEAAEAHAIKRTGEHSLLASIANNGSEALTSICETVAEWWDADTGDIGFQYNTDFMPVDMTAKELQTLFVMAQGEGPFTWEDFFWNAWKGERLNPTIEDDERMSKMQTEPPVMQSA